MTDPDGIAFIKCRSELNQTSAFETKNSCGIQGNKTSDQLSVKSISMQHYKPRNWEPIDHLFMHTSYHLYLLKNSLAVKQGAALFKMASVKKLWQPRNGCDGNG